MNQHTAYILYNRMEDNLDIIKEKINNGFSIAKIAKELGFNGDSLREFLDRKNIIKIKRRKVLLDDNVLEQAYKYALQGKSLKEISKILNISYKTLSKDLLKKYNYKPLPDGKKQVNSKYFSKISSQSKAYWLGFIAADGYVNKEKNVFEFVLIDKEMIEYFKEEIKSIHKISKKKTLLNGKIFESYRISIHDKNIINDLYNLNCTNNKSYEYTIPNSLPKKYLSHFLRGYFDGDGCTYISQNKLMFTITSASYNFLIQLQEILKSELNISCIIHKVKNKENWRINIAQENSLKIFNYIYNKSTSKTRLKRKYKKYINFCRAKKKS